MKTLFTEDEVKAFLRKKIAEMEGAHILMGTIETDNLDILNPSETIDRILNLGKIAGEIEGKLQMLRDMEKFFEL